MQSEKLLTSFHFCESTFEYAQPLLGLASTSSLECWCYLLCRDREGALSTRKKTKCLQKLALVTLTQTLKQVVAVAQRKLVEEEDHCIP